MKVVAKTDPEMVRERNEDYYLIDKTINLFIVADGMGEHQAGEVASELVAVTIRGIMCPRKSFEAGHP